MCPISQLHPVKEAIDRNKIKSGMDHDSDSRVNENLYQHHFGFPLRFWTICLQNYHAGDEQCSRPDFQYAYGTLQAYSITFSEHPFRHGNLNKS